MMPTSATANPALSAMKDIRLPPEIGFWPPAPAVLALLVLAMLSLIALSVWLYRRHQRLQRQQAPAKAALQLLSQLDTEDPQLMLHLSALLKRCAISYGGREHVASLTGEPWYQYLDQALPSKQQGKFQRLLQQRYQMQPAAEDAEELITLCQQWLLCAPSFYRRVGKGGKSC
jgi:cbb3-type cytochrome oxidase subunit 3